ncbi:hypothetical protein BKA66DRAFT_546829 [Pyrenochaeta sp. MPI-SDFR-AT-0127]|nr:hypothetical protein BKA66DRAFT_546829 [Pyrenochaeta sp. MPI-SDFR-AT-0127]
MTTTIFSVAPSVTLPSTHVPPQPRIPTPITNPDWSFDDGITSLEVLRGHELRPQQREALVDLYNGNDVVLVATTGFGKTLVITGFHNLIPPSQQPITLIISPQGYPERSKYGSEFGFFKLSWIRARRRHPYTYQPPCYRSWRPHTYLGISRNCVGRVAGEK